MAKDLYHDTVKTALEKDGWTITKDPFTLEIGDRKVFIDLAAEKIIAAERQGRQIAVEVKSFISPSLVKDLENALGQYILYADILAYAEQNRTLYLAVRRDIYRTFFAEDIVQIILANKRLKIIVFDPIQEVITQWID